MVCQERRQVLRAVKKRFYIQNNYNLENYIFITNKSLLDCDIKIDDKLDNLKNAKIKLLFDSYHNKGLSDDYLKSVGVVRVHSWLEIKDILEGIDESSSSKK